MTRGEVGQPVGAAHWLHVVHVALAAEVAAVRQVYLESLAWAGAAVGHRGPGHRHVVAAEEEEQAVAAEAEYVADED